MDKPQLAGVKRPPLTETNANVPSPSLKKQKLKSRADPVDSKAAATQLQKPNDKQTKAARLVGEELRTWQSSWRRIMRESVVYFDTQGCDLSNQQQYVEQKRAQRAFKLVGCEIVQFYDRDVSIIVSRRQFLLTKVYSVNDIFHDAVNLKIKVWDYEKVFRFLKNLGVSDSALANEKSENLSNLLKEEKIFGSTDRDPNARRDDLHYLEGNFVHVYDLSQAVRPIAVREWPSEDYPQVHLTLDGKCPFISDTSENLDRKKLRRLQKFEASKEYRELLRKVSYDIINIAKGVSVSLPLVSSAVTSPVRLASESNTIEKGTTDVDCAVEINEQDDDRVLPYSFKVPANLARNSSVMQPALNDSNSKFYDVAASGYNGASNALQYLMDSTLNSMAQQQAAQGNGLGPAVSQVPSRNVNNLKRRIFMKRQIQKGRELEREQKPGYCENCRVKYNHFDDHIMSNRHRNFACNDENFRDIDDLVATLAESKSMGYVSSNGDFSFEK